MIFLQGKHRRIKLSPTTRKRASAIGHRFRVWIPPSKPSTIYFRQNCKSRKSLTLIFSQKCLSRASLPSQEQDRSDDPHFETFHLGTTISFSTFHRGRQQGTFKSVSTSPRRLPSVQPIRLSASEAVPTFLLAIGSFGGFHASSLRGSCPLRFVMDG